MLGLIKGYSLYIVYLVGFVGFIMCMQGKIRIPLLFIIFLLPLRNVIDRMHTLPLGKDFVDILFILMLLGWLIKGLHTKGRAILPSSINPAIAVMVIYTLFSLLVGSGYLNHYQAFSISDPRVQLWKNFSILPLLFLLTYNNIDDEKWIWRAVLVMCAAMVIMDYYLVQQLRWYTNIISRKKISGTFVFLGPNEVAAFYNQYTIILMSLFFAIRKKMHKLLLAGLIVTNLFCVLFLFSRAAYMATAIGLFFLLLVRDRKLLIIFVLILIFWQTALPEKVRERIEQTHDEYGQLDESAAKRIIVWQHSMDLFMENPIMGVGFGVFPYLGFELGDTHNTYLKILAEQGMIGLFIFLLLIFVMFVEGVKLFSYGTTEMQKALGLGLILCIIVLLVNNMFGDRWSYVPLSSNLWVFTALVARFNYNRRQVLLAQRNAKRSNKK